MRILVIGSSGQVATSLRECATSQSHHLTAFGRPELDLTDRSSVEHAFESVEPEVVINAAAYTAVDLAETEKEKAFEINAEGPRRLAMLTSRADIPLVHLSTDYVFRGDKATAYLESDAVGPTGVYGASKLAGEQAIRDITDNHYIFRTAWVCSPHGKNFVKTMLRLATDRDAVSVVEDQFGTPTFADDISNALLHLLDQIQAKSPKTDYGTYHLVSSGITTWADFARAIFEESEKYGGPTAVVKGICTEDYPTPASRPANSRLNNQRIRDNLGILMPYWRSSLERCIKKLLQA